jgi:hypothetical protein
MAMIFTVQPDGGWKISRGSDFSGAGKPQVAVHGYRRVPRAV